MKVNSMMVKIQRKANEKIKQMSREKPLKRSKK